MAEEKKKAEFRKPASQLDLEARQEKGNASDRVLTTADTYEAPAPGEGDGRDFRVEGNKTDGYVGTNQEYMTYANKTEAPLEVKGETAEGKVFELFDELNTAAVIPSVKAGERPSDKVEPEPEVEPEAEGTTSTTPPK
jgi:hypothetical protein